MVPSGEDLAAAAFKNRLNSGLTFDTLVEGTANRMARAAAMHVAGMPGHLYNPLFIYGGVGLGKTHLMHAVGNRLLADRPDSKVLYIHAEQFVSDVVKAYQRRPSTSSRRSTTPLIFYSSMTFSSSPTRIGRRKNSSMRSRRCWPRRATSS
jgi:chromosomal replication initiation ATPase DnaA